MGDSTRGATVATQIETIADRQLEPDYFQKRTKAGDAEEALRERIQRDDRFLVIIRQDESFEVVDDVQTLTQRDEILGFGFFGTYTREEMEHYLAVPFEEVFSAEDTPIGHLRNVTLRDDVQGDSLGYRMASYAIGKLYELGHGVVVTCLWNQEGIQGTTEYAEKVGAERIAEYANYFDDRICPACGFSRDCTCSFAFFRWVLE